MAPKKTASGGKVTITTSPGMQLTPAAHQKLQDLTNELQKTGAVIDSNPATCRNYVKCGTLTKIEDPATSGGRLGPTKPVGPAKPIVTPVKKPL